MKQPEEITELQEIREELEKGIGALENAVELIREQDVFLENLKKHLLDYQRLRNKAASNTGGLDD